MDGNALALFLQAPGPVATKKRVALDRQQQYRAHAPARSRFGQQHVWLNRVAVSRLQLMALPALAPQLHHFAVVIKAWIDDHELSAKPVALLDEAFLRAQPLKPTDRPWPSVPQNKNYRFFWRLLTARHLGWTERRVEGSADGFSEEVSDAIRKRWP